MNFSAVKETLKDNQAAHFPWMERGLLCLAVFVSYASVWPSEFVWDDRALILLNSFLKSWSSLPALLTSQNYAGIGITGGFYRPVQMLIYFLLYQACGPSPVAFHALNVALQALNACLLHHFGIRAGFRKGAAFAAALVWAVHPLFTVDVAYIGSTAEPLWCCFCLLGLITLLPDFAPRKIWKAMLFFMLALGSKESAVVFPALAAVTFFFVSKERTQIPAYLKMWPFWLLSVGYIAAWLWYIHRSGFATEITGDPVYFQDYTSSFKNRVLTSFATLPVYARLIIWPSGLHVERVFPIFSTLSLQPVAGIFIAGLGLLQILRGWGGRALSFGILWFAMSLSPYTGIIIPTDAMISEGWMYMPTMGLFLGMAQTAAGFFDTRQNMARVLVAALVLSLSITTFVQSKAWRNRETLYQNTLENGGRVNRLSYHLGVYYMERGEFDKAIGLFQYEVDHPDGRANIQWANIHWRLAMSWLQVRVDDNDVILPGTVIHLASCQHIPDAIGELEKTLDYNPDYFAAHQALAGIDYYQGDNQMADYHEQQVNDILQKLGVH